MKSSQLPHCCWLKFALLFVTRRARKDWWAKHRLECTRQGFASSHVWNDHNWLKFARTQAVSLCAKSNQTNIDQQRTALTREGGLSIQSFCSSLTTYPPPWYALHITSLFLTGSKKIRNFCVLLHRRLKRTVEVGVPVFSQLKIVFSGILVSPPIFNKQLILFSISTSNSPPSPPLTLFGVYLSRWEWNDDSDEVEESCGLGSKVSLHPWVSDRGSDWLTIYDQVSASDPPHNHTQLYNW